VARSKQEQRCDWNEARMRLASARHGIKRACNSASTQSIDVAGQESRLRRRGGHTLNSTTVAPPPPSF
jgi:hypothetical protein